MAVHLSVVTSLVRSLCVVSACQHTYIVNLGYARHKELDRPRRQVCVIITAQRFIVGTDDLVYVKTVPALVAF